MSKRTSETTKCTRDFMQENIISLQEMQSCMRKNEETNSFNGKRRRNAFKHVPPKVNSFKSSSSKKGKVTPMEISELANKTLAGSHYRLVGNATQREHGRAKDSVPNETGRGRCINKGAILSCDMAESEMLLKDTKDVCTCTDLSTELYHNLPLDEGPSMFNGRRSLGCQTVGPRNWEEGHTMGGTMHPSTRKRPLSTLWHSKERLPSGGVERKLPGRSDDPDIQKLPPHEQKQNAREGQNMRNEVNYRKKKATSMKARQKSTVTSDPLRPPPTYRKGVIPKYLEVRRAAMREQAEEFKRFVPVPTCPSGHVTERKGTPKLLKKNHSDLVRDTKDVSACSDLSTDFSYNLPVKSEKPIAFTRSRSPGSGTVDPRNLEEIGGIIYSSTRKLPLTTLWHSKKRLPPGGVERKLPGRSDDPDIKKSPLCAPKQEVRQCHSVRTETDYGKTNVTSVEARHTPTETASDSLGPPATYQRGVIPKYLKKRIETMQKEEKKQCTCCLPEPTCPLEHVSDSYRTEYMTMLKKRHSDLLQELKMLPVTTDIRMMYMRKAELMKEVKDNEKIMKRLSELSILYTRSLSDED